MPAPPGNPYSCVATVLNDGRLLVAGGTTTASVTGAAALFDFGSGSWTPVGSLAAPRSGASAILLSSGEVLIAGQVSNPDWKVEAVRLAWQVDGVKKV